MEKSKPDLVGALSEHVSISRQFLKSIRIDADFGREDALSGYVCQGTARSLLEGMAKQLLHTKQRAFTWTGPYGGGKSSLALMLCSLVGPQAQLRAKAKKILDLPSDSPVHSAFLARGQGWQVLPIVGKRGSVAQEILSVLDKSVGGGRRRGSRSAVNELVMAATDHEQGVLLVIDELGKFLESSAQGSGDDIYFFQELAEAASRSSGKLVVVGILHQGFEAYANRLGREVRDDWAKVQGRFIDIPLVAASDEVVELVGNAITTSDAVDRTPVAYCVAQTAGAIRARRPGTPATLENSLAKCWPLHPVTAALLGPVSRRKFGQNERSTFGFLASREPHGFIEFLHGNPASALSMYEPARYWDYLRSNLEPAILASPDGHRWAAGVETVERAEAKGESIHIELTKTVALIELFRNGSGLVAEDAVLCVSVHANEAEDIRRALADLVSWKILIRRRHLEAYGIFSGSDFDIEGAITRARTELGAPSLEQISAMTNLQPVLAKRLYAQTGTMRWYTRRIARLSEIPQLLENFTPDKGSVGSFVLCLFEEDVTKEVAQVMVRRLSAVHKDLPLLLGVPNNAVRISELSLELQAAERVLKARPELEGDAVARRELIARISSVRGMLEDEMADAFLLSKWYCSGEEMAQASGDSLSAIASEMAGAVYPHAPHIFSELLNREEPSSNSVKARRDLMVAMIGNADKPNLGYEGYPADAGLYFTVLQSPGLHRRNSEDRWGFAVPGPASRSNGIRHLWFTTKALLESRGASVPLTEMYELWSLAPFGVRAGLLPVIGLAFYLAHQSTLALYVEGTFAPDIDERVVDDWLRNPARISLRFVAASKDQARFLREVARAMSDGAAGPVNAEPLDAARALVSLVVGLPGWSKRTMSVSTAAQRVRSTLLKASDPHKVLFSDLPTLLDASDTEELVARLRGATSELSTAYPKMLERVRTHLLRALDHRDRPLSELYERAISIKGLAGDFKLDAFTARLEVYDESDEAVEGLIGLAAGKAVATLVDRDVDAALTQLSIWSHDFRKAETLAPLRGRAASRRGIGVVFGAANRRDVIGSVDVSDADWPAVELLVKDLLTKVTSQKRSVALAAIAEAGAHLFEQQSNEEQT
jgi:hypothetical protein